jgi:hypothetical protein
LGQCSGMTPERAAFDGVSGASDTSAMTAHVPRLPFSLDPLMAEAKRRARQRRFLVALLALVIVGGVLGAVLATRPSGGPGPSGHGFAQRAQPGADTTRVSVPKDGLERAWVRWIKSQSIKGVGFYALHMPRVAVQSAVQATGARLIRLHVWPTRPASVEVVVVTTAPPAVYLRHRLARVLAVLGNGYVFVKAVNSRGSSIFQYFTRTKGGARAAVRWLPGATHRRPAR